MSQAILYIHGKGGSAAESEHFRALFPDCKVVGLDPLFPLCGEETGGKQ